MIIDEKVRDDLKGEKEGSTRRGQKGREREIEEGAKKDRARRFEDDATNANLTFPFARKKRRR